MRRVVILTNIQTPYRDPVYSRLSRLNEIELFVVYTTFSESNRHWKIKQLDFKNLVLIKNKLDIVFLLFKLLKNIRRFEPDVIISGGFGAPMLLAFIYAKLWRIAHLGFSDATEASEAHLRFYHRLIRYLIYGYSEGFIGASSKSVKLFQKYNAKPTITGISRLTVDINKFRPYDSKIYDVVYVGQFIERKNISFLLEILLQLKLKRSELRIAIAGSGPLKYSFKRKIFDAKIELQDFDNLEHSELPLLYGQSKTFIFPTLNDPWGLVLNEAMLSGCIVISSPNTGALDDLLINEYNSFVLEKMDIGAWVMTVLDILNNYTSYKQMALRARMSAEGMTYDDAAQGIFKVVSNV